MILGKPLNYRSKKVSTWGAFCFVLMVFAIPSAMAATFVLPKGDVIGQVGYANVKGGESLLDIARNHGLGFDEIKKANPWVDPWKPAAGTKILIPSRYILPKGKREGIVINIAEKRLYHYSRPKNGPPLVSTYPVSLGPDALKAGKGKYKVVQRVRKPTWKVSAGDRARMKADGKQVRKVVTPGRGNVLGEFALGLDARGLMIHGTNDPRSIGMNVKYGYIRMYPEDVQTLIHRTSTNTPVRIVNQAIKYGHKMGALYIELHKPDSVKGVLNTGALVNWMTSVTDQRLWADDWKRVRDIAEQPLGIAMPVVQEKPKPRAKRAWWLKLVSYKSIGSARNLVKKVDSLGVPLAIDGCYDNKPCTVLVGPFRDYKYIEEVRKKIKWMTRIKGYTVPYKEKDDFEPLAIVANAD